MEIHVRNYLKEYMSQLIQRYPVSTIPVIRYEIKSSSITSLSTTQELTALHSSICSLYILTICPPLLLHFKPPNKVKKKKKK